MPSAPLGEAACNGHEEVVKVLLGRDDIDPNKPDHFGRTPLWLAASNAHEGVVKVLLERGDVNPDKPDEDGQTPLSQAAFYGHEGVVNYSSDGGMSIPTNQMCTAGHHSGGLPARGAREW